MKFCLLVFAIALANAQNQIELQFIGDHFTEEEVLKRHFCETKYCLLDNNYLLYSATQNKSVKPCDDFKEFALGTFIKYRSISDRKFQFGFLTDVEDVHSENLREVLASQVNEDDTRITKGMKKVFKTCVKSDFVIKNGTTEIREYAKLLGLRFYPEKNQEDFDVAKYIEQEPSHALSTLFDMFLLRFNSRAGKKGFLQLVYYESSFAEERFAAYEDMLSNLNRLHLKPSLKLKKEFKNIAEQQFEFYKRLVSSNIFISKVFCLYFF